MSAAEPNLYEGLWEGPIDHKASSVINAIASETLGSSLGLHIGESLFIVEPPTAETLPRVRSISDLSEGFLFYGVGVAGDVGNSYPVTSIDVSPSFDPLLIAIEGDGVRVCTQGRCVARVTTFTAAINIGDALAPNQSGELIFATSGRPVVARALQSISQIAIGGSVQYMAVDIQREGILS